jgi:hypothetical protein
MAARPGPAGPGCHNGPVTAWKPHALAHPAADQLDLGVKTAKLGFKVTTKVVAKRDLPEVPAGTHGKVLLANGFNWLRYRVHFANGVELADLDGGDIDRA